MTPEEEEEWVESIKAEDDEIALEKLRSFQLPKTPGFFQAPSGHRLHVRTILPSNDPTATEVKAVIIHCHGMNSHVNGRNWGGEFLPRVAKEGFAVFAVDIMGHGYSEGTRALIEAPVIFKKVQGVSAFLVMHQDWHDVFDDLEALAEAIFNDGDEQDFNAAIPPEVLERLRRRPLFIDGLSMGGMIGFHLGLRLQEHPRLQKIFRGAVLGAPSLQVPMPPEAQYEQRLKEGHFKSTASHITRSLSHNRLSHRALYWICHLDQECIRDRHFGGRLMGEDNALSCSIPCCLAVLCTAGLILLVQFTQIVGSATPILGIVFPIVFAMMGCCCLGCAHLRGDGRVESW
eukprot:symbB.v1.2.012061.t1/scaffold825.1/size159525/2